MRTTTFFDELFSKTYHQVTSIFWFFATKEDNLDVICIFTYDVKN